VGFFHKVVPATKSDIRRIEAKIDALLGNQTTNRKETEQIMLDLTSLNAAVANEKTVEDSVIALLSTLTGEIATLITASGNSVDPASLQAIVDKVNANAATLAAAVKANTPAAQ
jgi:hypothetical protein